VLSTDESNALFEVVTDYTYALDTLDNYDYQRLTIQGNHPRGTLPCDGNKRIAATLFLWFLNNNRILYHADGSKRIPDNTLVALTLMIAESRTEEKDVMVKVVVNLINHNN
jgi:prophage maintenance system killer protein